MPEATPGQSDEPAVRVVRGAGAFEQLGPAWDDLMGRARDAVPYLARAWVSPWVESGRARGVPLAIGCWAGDRLVALLALTVRRRFGQRVAEPAATGCPGYYGLLLDPDHPAAVERIAGACRAEFSTLEIADLSSLDSATHALLAALSARGFAVARVHRNPCRSIKLGCTFEHYLLETKSKKSRANIRREEKKLREHGRVELAHLRGAEITEDWMRRVAELQQASWMRERGSAVLGEDAYRRVTLSAAHAGLAQLWVVTVDGRDAAFVFGLLVHGRLHYVWTAFRLDYEALSIGKVLTSWVIRDACAQGVARFDFGQGDAEYKRFWSTDAHEVSRAAAGRGLLGRV